MMRILQLTYSDRAQGCKDSDPGCISVPTSTHVSVRQCRSIQRMGTIVRTACLIEITVLLSY